MRKETRLAVLTCVCVFLALTCIILISAKVGDQEILGAKIDFAVAVTSGVLAVVAIIFTITMSGALTGAADRLTTAAAEFSNAKEDILQAIQDVPDRVKQVIDETEEQLGDDEPPDQEPPPTGAGVIPASPPPPSTPEELNRNLVDTLLKNCKFSGLECLYALQKACATDRPLRSREIIKCRGDRFYGFYYGFVVAVRSIELVKFTASRGTWTVTWIHPRIEERLESAISGRLGAKRRPGFEKLKAMLGVE